jgi:hypothetical protein
MQRILRPFLKGGKVFPIWTERFGTSLSKTFTAVNRDLPRLRVSKIIARRCAGVFDSAT